MSEKILEFRGLTTLDIPVPRTLKSAVKANLQCAVVIGYDNDGEFYFASSKSDGGYVLWLLETAKKQLMEVDL